MEVVLIFGFWLFVVTLVGHGIWLFVAFVLRSLTEPYQPPRTVAPIALPKKTCPHCGAWCAATFQKCPTCGKSVVEQPRSPAAKLQSLQRQLDLLLAEDVLSLEQFESARVVLQQAADKLKRPEGDETEELPTLVAADDVALDRPNVGHVSNVPANDGHVENVPHGEPEHKRSTWTDWLQAFLEEKNIRWGELLAGMLIVGSSVGLVISLWSTLKNAIPYFPALCFLAVTAAIHGAGLYTLRHWRLKTTSRGLLTIALLLVPLNFLAAIALSEQRSATDPLYVTAVIIGVAAYGWITWSGTRELMHFGATWLSLAVLGSAIGQLVIGRLTLAGLSTLELHGLFALPLATYAVALLGTSHFAASWRRLSPRRVESLYRLLGIAFFSLAVALSLLLWKSQAVLDTLSRLSPCVSLAAAMIVGVAGRLLPNVGHVFNVPVIRRHVENVPHDIAATAVTLIGAMLMVVAVVLAWPDPERLIAVGVVNFLALSWFGFATGLAPLHVPALASLTLAGLIAFHRFGQVIGGAGVSEGQNLIATILLGRSGVVVALMSLLTAFVARCLPNETGERGGVSPPVHSPQDRGADAAPLAYLAAAACMAVLSLGIAGYAGFWPHVVQPSIDRSLPTFVFVLFGIAGMVANERLNRTEIAWAGAVVWLAVFLHALGWNTHVREWLDGFGLLPTRPMVVALLSFATWSLGCAIVGKYRDRFVTPWSAASGRATVVALFVLPWKVWGDFGPHAIYLGWVAALCLGQAHLWQSRNLFSLSQVVAFIAASLGVASFAQHQDWWIAYGNDVSAFWDVRHGHWQMAGLAVACVPWVVWRRFGGKYAVLARCCDWKVDRVVQPTLVIAAAVTMWFSLWPFIGFERYQRSSEWPVVLQPWLGRGWDRVLLWLIGWGAVTWSMEEVLRCWFGRRREEHAPATVPVRFPWMAALGTFAVGGVMFLLPQMAWRHIPLSLRLRAIDPELLFGMSMWWTVLAVLSASLVPLAERGRWKVRLLVIACWSALWQFTTPMLVSDLMRMRSRTGGYVLWFLWKEGFVFLWLTPIGIALLLCTWLVSIGRRVAVPFGELRRPVASTVADDAWGVVGFLCLLPTIVLGPQINVWVGAEALSIVALLWGALILHRAGRTESIAVMFGASHAWCLVFAAIALVSSDEVHRRMIEIGSSEAAFVRFLGYSASALAVFGMSWYGLRSRVGPLVPSWLDWRREPRRATITPWLWHQLWMWSCVLLSSLLAALTILNGTNWAETWRLAFRGIHGHVAFALVVVSTLLTERSWSNRLHSLGLWSMAWVPVLSASLVSEDVELWFGGPWGRFHVWIVGWIALAVVWTGARCLTSSSHKETSLWSDAASIGVVLLAIWEFASHQSVSWPATSLAIVAVCASASAWVNRSQLRVAALMMCVALATVMAWRPEVGGWLQRAKPEVVTWLEAGLVSLGVAALTWQIVEVWWQRRRGERFDPVGKVAACRWVARVVLGTALLFVFCAVLVHAGTTHRGLRDAQDLFWNVHPLAGALLWFGVAMTFVVSAWDRFSKTTVAGLYGSIWLALLLVFESRELPMSERWSVWAIGLMATDVAIVGAAWWQAKGSGVFFTPPSGNEVFEVDDGGVKKTPDPVTLGASWRNRLAGAEQWLSNAQLAWATAVSMLAIFGVLNFGDRSLRLWCVVSAGVLVPGIAALASSRRRELFQRVALGLGAVWLVDCLWALMEPELRADFWLQRSIRALEALSVTAFVYGVGLERWIRVDNDWRSAVQRAARDAGVLAIVALMFVLSLEAWWFDPINGAPVTGLQIALVAAVLVGLAVALLTMALTDGQPAISNLKSEISNLKSEISIWKSSLFFTPQAFVYAAEVVVALLFLHCYLTMPELFRGYLQPYWPLIVMAIAFAGVGASELCQRAKLSVLSEPLQNSAALLPLIPALGFWVATSRTDYSSVLFAAGLVYVWLNLRRRSFWYVLAASLAGNFGLWSLWSEHGVELLVRPQVWLIPPAISVLAAAQWNRQRLTEAQLAAIRYPAITLLYVSSAGEMFLTGIAESFWLPVVLMVLSVSGVLAGIWLRVRAFLYLGASFLLLSLVSMVWHAAEAIDHTWPWWAFGIGLGLGVLTLFGLFERKRNEMLRLLGELRTWER